MRRADREITDREEIERIIARAQVCRIAMCDGDTPYVVPVCFGHEGDHIYVHAALEGKKTDILRRNPRVCVEFEVDVEVAPCGETCQGWTMRYRSVIGQGVARLVADPTEKSSALNAIMIHYGGAGGESYTRERLDGVTVIEIAVETLTGKRSGYP